MLCLPETKNLMVRCFPIKTKTKTNKAITTTTTTTNPSAPLAYFHHRPIDYQIVKGKVLLRPVFDRHSSVRNGNAIDREVL